MSSRPTRTKKRPSKYDTNIDSDEEERIKKVSGSSVVALFLSLSLPQLEGGKALRASSPAFAPTLTHCTAPGQTPPSPLTLPLSPSDASPSRHVLHSKIDHKRQLRLPLRYPYKDSEASMRLLWLHKLHKLQRGDSRILQEVRLLGLQRHGGKH